MGTPGRAGIDAPPPVATAPTFPVQRVQNGIKSAARFLPFQPSCLAQAFAGQQLLRSVAIPGNVVIGLKPDPTPPWAAHAWLVIDGQAVLGGLENEVYFPSTTYSLSD